MLGFQKNIFLDAVKMQNIFFNIIYEPSHVGFNNFCSGQNLAIIELHLGTIGQGLSKTQSNSQYFNSFFSQDKCA
jgi:hypothetical protein